MVCFDTPSSRPTSSARRPASNCFNAPIISASLCFPFDITPLLVPQNHIHFPAVSGEQVSDPQRFADGKAVASYIGMIPSEHSSGGRQRFGRISKQGNALLRFLWGKATIHAVRRDPELRRFYRRKLVQKGMGKARVAAARKLGIRLWVMLRDEIDYAEFCRRGHQRRQGSGAACAGMLHGDSGPN